MGVVHSIAGPAAAGLRAPAQRAGDRRPAGPGHLRATATRWTGGPWPRTTTSSATTSPASSPASRTSTPASGSTNGFVLPNPPRDSRTFATATGKARFTVSPLEYLARPAGHLLLQTIRSHDQYNTTIYGLDDRYRGISRRPPRHPGAHRTTFTNSGFKDRDLVDVISTFRGTDGQPANARGQASALVGLPDRHAAAPPPTSPRPTRWCRWTMSPSAPTPPCRKRSRSGSNHTSTASEPVPGRQWLHA